MGRTGDHEMARDGTGPRDEAARVTEAAGAKAKRAKVEKRGRTAGEKDPKEGKGKSSSSSSSRRQARERKQEGQQEKDG